MEVGFRLADKRLGLLINFGEELLKDAPGARGGRP